MLLIALFTIVAVVACGFSLARHEREAIASMSDADIALYIEEGCMYCEDVSPFVAEQERRAARVLSC